MNAMPKIRDFDEADYDPYTASERIANTGHVTNVYPELKRLRQEAPIWELDLRAHLGTLPDQGMLDRRKWSVLGYKEVTTVLGDPALFSNTIYEPSLGVSFGRPITVMDPPEHRAYRMLFQKAFTPRMIADWGKSIIPTTINKVIDEFADRGHADLVHDLAIHFPFRFIHELLHLPVEDRTVFQKLAFSQTTVRFDPKHGIEGGGKLREYLIGLVEHRRRNPLGDGDFVTTLANAEVDGERIPEEILISFLRQLMNAGGDTSYNGFSSVMAALLQHPDQLDAVRKDRNLVPAAIEEGLRWEGPIMILDRTPTQEITMAGVTMRPGDHVGVVIAAANRDESVYPDPDTFNVFRKQQRHNAFGYGPHVCLGQHLARLEMVTALNALLDRLPNLRLDPDKPVPVVRGVTLRKPNAVDVLFG